MNPHLVSIVLGVLTSVMLHNRYLKSTAVGFAHYSVQQLLIALAGDAATGVTGLPLWVQIVFFPITVLLGRPGPLPFGALLNSTVAALVCFVVVGAPSRHVKDSKHEQAGPSTLDSNKLIRRIRDTKYSVADWMRSIKTDTIEIQSIQDGAHYWISGGKIPWGAWTITVVGQGWLKTKRAVYCLCLATPELLEKLGHASFRGAVDASHITLVPISQFTDQDETLLRRLVANVVETAPRAQWDSLIRRELALRFNTPVPST